MANDSASPWVVVLGTAQDGGFPQAGCVESCCAWAREDPARRRLPACLGIVNPATRQRWIIDCTPEFPEQLHRLNAVSDPSWGIAGVFLTHAHIGHYVGLIHLGTEVMGAHGIPTYVMPRMRTFIESDSPWRELTERGNVDLRSLSDGEPIQLAPGLSITPFQVPHRDEISETVGFRVEGPDQAVVHLPDIDAWSAWSTPVGDMLATVDVAWVDGTFFDDQELPHRNMAAISHPTIDDSLQHFASLPDDLRDRIRFTHLNHSNPVVDEESAQADRVRRSGCYVAREGETSPVKR